MTLTPDDLPERVEAWGAIDRIVWQDVDSERLSTPQRDALRGWIAGGGRLIIAGGTAGPKTLSAFPDSLLPYRPGRHDRRPGRQPERHPRPAPADRHAAAGPVRDARSRAGRSRRSATRSSPPNEPTASGSVALIGFDPTVDWIAEDRHVGQSLAPACCPPRTNGGLTFTDDNMLVNAVSQLPTLALPPISGLLALLVAYILLIGPINYLVLKRLDRREWAWVTMPILIVVFAAGAYAYGAALRGSDVIVNEIAIVRGAPGATEGSAQAYLGVFSPTRSVYQVSVPGGALLSTSINGDMFGGIGTTTVLDVLQGDPARVRDLSVGFGSLRTIRAETAVAVPLIETDLRLEDGHLKGTVKNASSQRLERPAVVLGQTVAVLDDLEPGAEATIDVAVQFGQFQQSLSDKVVGQFFGNEGAMTPELARTYVRHYMVDQLTYDPMMGTTNLLSADGPVVLAWDSSELIPVEIAGQKPRHLGNVLYYLPARLAIHGSTTFRSDLMRSTVVEADAVLFSKEPSSVNFGRGSVTMAYRPIGFDGRLDGHRTGDRDELRREGTGRRTGPGQAARPRSRRPASQPRPMIASPMTSTALAEVELFDIEDGAWQRLPHLQSGHAVRGRFPGSLRRSRPRGPSSSASSTSVRTASGSRSTCRSPGTSSERDRPHRGPGQALRPDARGGRHRPGHRPGRDLRAGRAQRRRQDDDPANARDAAPPRSPGPPRSTAGR